MDINYYDEVLAGIFASLILGLIIGVFTSLPLVYGVGTGAAVSIGIIYHGMFRNAPSGGDR